MAEIFEESFINLFNITSPLPQLVNFATGIIASPEVEASMLVCLDKGQTSDQFVTHRLISQDDVL